MSLNNPYSQCSEWLSGVLWTHPIQKEIDFEGILRELSVLPIPDTNLRYAQLLSSKLEHAFGNIAERIGDLLHESSPEAKSVKQNFKTSKEQAIGYLKQLWLLLMKLSLLFCQSSNTKMLRKKRAPHYFWGSFAYAAGKTGRGELLEEIWETWKGTEDNLEASSWVYFGKAAGELGLNDLFMDIVRCWQESGESSRICCIGGMCDAAVELRNEEIFEQLSKLWAQLEPVPSTVYTLNFRI